MGRRNPPARWVLPETINPEGRKCITIPVPDERFHIAAFWGALRNLASGAQWADDPDHKAREVAIVWRDIIDDLEWGCGLEDVRQNEDEPCTLEKTFDGETWEPFADLQKCPPNIRVNKGIIEWFNPVTEEWEELSGGDERTDGTAEPPYPGNPDGACLAAENITAIYQTALTEIRAGVVAAEVAVAIAATITGIMSLFIAPAIVSTAALAITGIALDIGESGLDTMLDPAHLDNFKCVLYCNIESDGSVTASDFTALRAEMAGWASGLELAIIEYWLDGFGSVGLTRQGRAGGITSGDCSDCACAWAYRWVFTVTDGGWEPSPILGAVHTGGVWSYVDELSGSTYYRGLEIKKVFDSTATGVTQLEFTYNLTKGTAFSDGLLMVGARANGTSLFSFDTFGELVNGDEQTFIWPIGDPLDDISVTARSSAENSAIYSGSAAITSVILRGSGVPPTGLTGGSFL